MPSPRSRDATRRIHLLAAALVFGLDRLTKWLVAREIALHDSIQIIPGCFRTTHVENRGAAFSLFCGFQLTMANVATGGVFRGGFDCCFGAALA